jgi:hypothetical protein
MKRSREAAGAGQGPGDSGAALLGAHGHGHRIRLLDVPDDRRADEALRRTQLLAYAGMPYQVLGDRPGALASMIA